MDETDHGTLRPAASRERSSRSMSARWGMLLGVLALAALVLFAGWGTGGAWSTGGTGLIFLLFLLPCLLMPFMMGRGHSGTSDQNNVDDKGGPR